MGSWCLRGVGLFGEDENALEVADDDGCRGDGEVFALRSPFVPESVRDVSVWLARLHLLRPFPLR